jgi:hypothetical protein
MGTDPYPLVSLRRREFDDAPWYGFVVGRTDELLAIHQVSDRYSLDGYRIFRCSDLTEVDEKFHRRSLIEAALSIKHQSPREPSDLDLSGMRRAMETAQALYPVLIIDRERIYPDEVEVGTVRMTSEETYVLRWLSPEAIWEDDDRPFRYRDVTMLEFAGEYEQTLALVAQHREKGVQLPPSS